MAATAKPQAPLFTKRALFTLIWPLLLEQTLSVTMGMADTLMVSGVGEAAVSSVSLVDSLNILIPAPPTCWHSPRNAAAAKGPRSADPELAQMRNVAGEIKGSEAAMQYALDHKIPSIIIYHDYQGIASWCNGDWKANKAGTIAYRDFYRKAKERVHIEFRKVKGHSNDKYNDMVDELAKEALGIH